MVKHLHRRSAPFHQNLTRFQKLSHAHQTRDRICEKLRREPVSRGREGEARTVCYPERYKLSKAGNDASVRLRSLENGRGVGETTV